jgi:hypothetical protein
MKDWKNFAMMSIAAATGQNGSIRTAARAKT